MRALASFEGQRFILRRPVAGKHYAIETQVALTINNYECHLINLIKSAKINQPRTA